MCGRKYRSYRATLMTGYMKAGHQRERSLSPEVNMKREVKPPQVLESSNFPGSIMNPYAAGICRSVCVFPGALTVMPKNISRKNRLGACYS